MPNVNKKMNQQKQKQADSVEEIVRHFYDHFGWVSENAQCGEDVLFRQFRTPYYPYHDRVIDRTLSCFSGGGDCLLLAGGGDLPESHIKLAQQFLDVFCLDISQKALEIAESKLQERSRYCLGSILDIPFPANTFDAVFCAHVIYHIDIDLQESAIDELIRVTKEGGRIVIIYSNPDSLINRILALRDRVGRLVRRFRKKPEMSFSQPSSPNRPPLYFARHPLRWWNRFEPRCKVSMLPWDVMGNRQEKVLLRSDRMANLVYRVCSWIEEKFPNAAVRSWQYPIIIIDKSTD